MMKTPHYPQKQLSYPGPFLRLISMSLDVILLVFIASLVMPIITLSLFSWIFADGVEAVGMPVKSLEDIRLLMTSQDFIAKITIQHFVRLFFYCLAIQFFLVSFYFVYCWHKFGTTPGKVIFRMKVVDIETHNNLSLTRSITRYCGYLLSIPSLLSIVISKNRRGLHDYLAKSIVIKI